MARGGFARRAEAAGDALHIAAVPAFIADLEAVGHRAVAPRPVLDPFHRAVGDPLYPVLAQGRLEDVPHGLGIDRAGQLRQAGVPGQGRRQHDQPPSGTSMPL